LSLKTATQFWQLEYKLNFILPKNCNADESLYMSAKKLMIDSQLNLSCTAVTDKNNEKRIKRQKQILRSPLFRHLLES